MRILVLEPNELTPDRDAGSFRLAKVVELLRALKHEARVATEPPDDDESFDLVILSRPEGASRWLEACRKRWPNAKLIFDTVDLHHIRLFRAARLHGNQMALRAALEMKALERKLFAGADQVWVVTEPEAEIVRQEAPDADVRVVAIPGTPCDNPPPFESRRDIIFVANFRHAPNEDALRFYAGEVWPKIRETLPEARTHVVGANPPDVNVSGIEYVGWAPDLAPVYAAVRVAIAPLRFGAGLKGKVVEAMGQGVPVVGTAVAWEGIPDACPCADAESFAREVIRLHQDESAWQDASVQGRELARSHFSDDAVRDQLCHALGSLS